MILAMSAITAYYYPLLPERMPVHWNFAGQVDGYGPRWHVWVIGPVMMGGFLLLGLVLPWLSPKKFELEASGATYGYMISVPVAVMACVELFALSNALGYKLDMSRAPMLLVFAVLILLGNPMGKVRRNFFMGIRTPWTLASERVWNATHRLAGKLMVASGLLGMLALWLGAPHWALLVLTIAWAPLVAGYSLLLYKRLPQ
ncbi:SdpI family protein [Duganella sp. 1224]|uniref:SdpI family protein n=1 Tax=Duganella sp. 1224 TaxID=2587052 RepID=UPI0021055DE2|nr:SdpI family protein [Duganella sp. 1224]